jgi:hypothetical protein
VKVFFAKMQNQAFTTSADALGSYVTTLMIGYGAAGFGRWRGGNRGRLLTLVVLFGSCLVSCGDDRAATPTPPGADSGAPEPDGSATDGGPPARPPCQNPPIPEGELQNRASGPSVFGIVVGGDPGLFDAFGGTECGLAGVRICQLGTNTCTDSDPAGQFVLNGLPAGQDLEISFEKPSMTKPLRLVHTGNTPINLEQTRLLTFDPTLELFARAGIVLDNTNKGNLVAVPIAAGEGIGGIVVPEGVVITLKPSGPAALYTLGIESSDGLSKDDLDPSLQATRFGGWGIFANVDPGDYAVRFERNGQACSTALPGFGYGADAEGNIRVKILAGHSTASIAAFCQ